MIQSDLLNETHASVLVCPITTALANSPALRLEVHPSSANGLVATSQIMADKLLAIRVDRIANRIGRLEAADMLSLDRAVALVLGLTLHS
jgi:mRNA interferase MazF